MSRLVVRSTNSTSSGSSLSRSIQATSLGELALPRSAGRSPRPARRQDPPSLPRRQSSFPERALALWQPALSNEEIDDPVESFTGLQVGEEKGPRAAHALRVTPHDLEVGADQRRQIDLVDDQKVRSGDAGSALARDLVAGRDIDHVDRQIGELGREGGGKVVAARFDQHQVETREQPVHLGHRGKVDRGVLADSGVRAAAGLDTADPFGRQCPAPDQKFGVLTGIDIVGDRRDLPMLAHPLAQPIHQRGLAGSDRAADPDPQRIALCLGYHDRKSLEYCVSCAIEARSTAIVAVPKQAGSRVTASATALPMMVASAARIRWPSVWPTIPRRSPAETRLAVIACRYAVNAQPRGMPARPVAAPAAAGWHTPSPASPSIAAQRSRNGSAQAVRQVEKKASPCAVASSAISAVARNTTPRRLVAINASRFCAEAARCASRSVSASIRPAPWVRIAAIQPRRVSRSRTRPFAAAVSRPCE